jgi:predicted RNase H-like HicB family nuclease
MKREYSVVYQETRGRLDHGYGAGVARAVTQGRDLAEARSMIKEAVEPLLESYRDHAVQEAPGNAIWETLTVDLVPA